MLKLIGETIELKSYGNRNSIYRIYMSSSQTLKVLNADTETAIISW